MQVIIEIQRDRSDELRGFLAKDPVQNLFALGIHEEHGVGGPGSRHVFLGLLEGGKVVGTALVGGAGGLVVPCVFDPSAATELGRHLSERKVTVRSAMGERNAVDALVRAAGCGPARRSRPQRLFAASADDLGPFVCPDLRLARPEDLPQLIQMTAAAVRESQGEDPMASDAASFARRVEARVLAGRNYVLVDGKKILMKIDLGTRSRYGVELEGMYVLPEVRRRGVATLVLGQVTRLLLSSIPRITMRVDEKDAGIAAVCRKVGYTAMRPQRLVIL